MTILLVGTCVNGMVRKNGQWNGQWGITDPRPCEKCNGKGCAPKRDVVEPEAVEPDDAAS